MKLDVTTQEAQIIIEALHELKARVANPVINKILPQYDIQVKEEMESKYLKETYKSK